MKSLTSRSVDLLRKEYPLVETVERFNSFTKRRHDLFGIIDILAVRDNEILMVQTTSKSNMRSRVIKIEDSDALPVLRKAEISIHVHGWYKENNRWRVKIIDLS